MTMYGYSLDGENFTGDFATRAEALEEAIEEARSRELTTVDTCRAIAVDVATVWKQAHGAESLLERIAEVVYDDYGEAAAEWFDDTPKDKKADLDAMLAATFMEWLKKHCLEPTFWQVADTQNHPVPTDTQP